MTQTGFCSVVCPVSTRVFQHRRSGTSGLRHRLEIDRKSADNAGRTSERIGMITSWPALAIAIVALTLFSVVTPRTATAAGASYVGNAACSGCHEQATVEWAGSHHDLAMQEATPETVLGDFNDATFNYFGVTTTFSQKGGDTFFIEDR